jgi:excinuclease UvrABC nuclease subunit
VNREELVKILEKEMEQAAESLDFERAALLRDQLFERYSATRVHAA